MTGKAETITSLIFVVRGQRVILDSDLAKLYGVLTERLTEQCKRNIKKFPEDFRFQLTKQEVVNSRSQIASSNLIPQNAGSKKRGGNRKLPYVFTEHGAIMAANVLKSETAIDASVKIVRAFVQMRQMIVDVEKLERRISKMEKEYDHNFAVVFETIREMIIPQQQPKRKIGFIIDNKKNVS